MVNKKETTHIRITEELKTFIASKGIFGESYDTIIKRMVKFK